MFAPDVDIWGTGYMDYTFVEVPANGKSLEVLTRWLEDHAEDEWAVAEGHVAFMLESDAIMFKLGFK